MVSISPTPTTRHPTRNQWIAIGAIGALVLAVGIPFGVWAGEQVGIQTAAREDAAALVAAESAAREAATEYAETVDVATAYLDADARPTLTVVTGQAADFGQEAADALSDAVAALETAIAPPAETAEDADAGEDADAAPAVDEQDLTVIRLDVPADRDLVASALEDEYRRLDADEREAARTAASAETHRLTALAAGIRAHAGTVRTAVDAIDAAIVAVATSAVTTGAGTLESLEYASDESKAALGAAIDTLEATIGIELPVSWADRAAGTPTPVADVIAAIGEYGSASASAHASEDANAPDWTDSIEYDPCLATLCSVNPFWPLF